MGTKSTTSIGDALFGRTRQRVLTVLFGQPERRVFLNELVREAGAGKGAVQREIERLVASGLIEAASEGRQRYFRASAESPIFHEIEALVRKTFGIGDVLKVALAPLAKKIVFAGLYGSMARGTAHARSDVDLLVVGDVDYLALSAQLVQPETALRRAVNPTVFTLSEWQRRLREDSGFARDILSRPVIPLIGDIDVLGKPGEDRKPARAARRSSGARQAAGGSEKKPGRRKAR